MKKIVMSAVWFLRFVRFEFLKVVKIPILVFLILTPFVLIYGCQRAEVSCSLHLPCVVLQLP